MTDSMTPDDGSPEQLARLVDKLQRELVRVQAERDQLQAALTEWLGEALPPEPDWAPPAPADTVRARDHLATLLQKHRGGTT